MRKGSWKNVRGETHIDIETQIDFKSTGYYDPGKISGPPENCYPPEGEDERTVVSITFFYRKKQITIKEHDCKKLFDFISDAANVDIQSTEIDTSPQY